MKDTFSVFEKPVICALNTHTHIVTPANKSIKMLLYDTMGSGSLKIKQTLLPERYVTQTAVTIQCVSLALLILHPHQ